MAESGSGHGNGLHVEGGHGEGPEERMTGFSTHRNPGMAAGTHEQIMAQLNAVNALSIGEAQLAWRLAADKLRHVAQDLLPSIAADLASAWSDEASVGAQQQLQIAQATAVALANDSADMVSATGVAHEAAKHYTAEDNRPKTGFWGKVSDTAGVVADVSHSPGAYVAEWGADKLSGDDKAAQEYLQSFMNNYDDAATAMPNEVRARLAHSDAREGIDEGSDPDGPGPGPSTGGGGGVGGGGASATVPALGGSGAGGGTGSVAGMGGLGDPYSVGGSSLAGAGGEAGFGSGLGTAAGSGFGSGSGGWGTAAGAGAVGAAGLGAGVAGAGGLGRGAGGRFGSGGAATGAGSGGGAAGRGAGGRTGGALSEQAMTNGRAGAAGRGSGAGMMGAPMGGGRGGDEEERERTSWLMEDDDDIWGTKTDAPPPIITE
jgi:hypothetical protein